MKRDLISLRNIPAVGKLLENGYFKELQKIYSREEVLFAIRSSIEDIKRENFYHFRKSSLLEIIKLKTKRYLDYPLLKVINATGILIHTNLGRAPLLKNEKKLLETYSNLEIELERGKRDERNNLAEKLLKYLLNCEGACITNNNASSMLLILSTFAKGGEVIISRGELIEIGGSFRLPDILKESGCFMVEVGTTNKTKIEDYQEAINEKTKAILYVHPSNFRILGFQEKPKVEEICNLAHKNKLPFFVDQGNGLLFEVEGFDLKDEEPVKDFIKIGADIVTFSGDKLLGGPQAGIAVGKKEYIKKMLKNPLYRALRPGKETFFYLQETLKFWLKKDLKPIPLWNLAYKPLEILKKRAKNIKEKVKTPILIEDGYAQFGGGTTPILNLPSIVLKLKSKNPEEIYLKLLNEEIPILTFIKDSFINFNLKSVFEEEDNIIIETINKITV